MIETSQLTKRYGDFTAVDGISFRVEPGQVLDPEKALANYLKVFEMIGTWGIGIGAGFIVLSPILAWLAHPEKSEG